MSETQRAGITPGKWEVGGPYPSVSVVSCIAGPTDSEPAVYDVICILDLRSKGEADAEMKANARAIAALPECLESLRLCQSAIQGLKDAGDHHDWESFEQGGFHEALASANRALAKAGVAG